MDARVAAGTRMPTGPVTQGCGIRVKGVGQVRGGGDPVVMSDRDADRTDAAPENALEGADFTDEMEDGEVEADGTSGATGGGRVADA
ncbi:hypothetical protein GCM10027071_28660 [Microbacterium marinum]